MILKHYLFYPFCLLLFILDIFCFSFFEKQIFYSLLCFYIISLYQEMNVGKLMFIGLLISLESSLHYDIFGTQLLYLVPITIIAYQTQKTFYSNAIQPYLLLIACLLTQSFLVEPYLLHIPAPISYTNSKIIANIVVLWCMSLIVNSQGKLGNRFQAFIALKRKVRTPNE